MCSAGSTSSSRPHLDAAGSPIRQDLAPRHEHTTLSKGIAVMSVDKRQRELDKVLRGQGAFRRLGGVGTWSTGAKKA